ncbi:DUF2125 domain-containing protein [Azospirillum doebereinerae]|uniref:DUF2125 domain-containing protein n=1 Tax=Azospirillum doebereinerae TaxID=92933 RepID=A0A433JAP9_9PROT|nr:DUF2125 domain-containing protein [Azospirillum doebereinerae]RUQ72887.1 DUF2125 domain-containing protein [Azospirillum doebereinerae]
MRFPKLRGRFGLILVLVVALPLAGYAVWWWQAARAVERGVLAWIEEQRTNGALVEHGGLTVGGFPLILRAVLEQPHLALRGAEWRGPRLVAEAAPWKVTHVALSLPGEQRLTLVQAGQPPLDVTARGGGTGQAVWTLVGSVEQMRLSFTDLVAQAAEFPVPIAALEISAAQPSAPPADHTATGLTVSMTANGVTLPESAPPSLGRSVTKAELTARVLGRPPRPEPASLSAWSRDGGTVELDRLGLDWGPLAVAMNGTLALDGQLQPQAALTAEIRGANAVLDVLKPMMRPNEAALARTVLTMLARPSGPGGEPVITAPVTVQNRALYLGPLKIAAMPIVAW